VFNNPTLTWDDLAWLRSQTSLPVVLKGCSTPTTCGGPATPVCRPSSAATTAGGRSTARSRRSTRCPGWSRSRGELPVLFDSGVRTGADAAKALALGATAVLLGRPVGPRAGAGGEAGVHHVLRSFLADLDLQVGLSGHSSVHELSRESVQQVC
jgi:isopentenyl diphosphate isomerase/L-lactate dehydrogenase-like FMN-dependent dehydrogenase